MITDRQSRILSDIVLGYITTGGPVSSKALASGDLEVSSATVRNDMQILEKEGYITQPHTSSGRVPTDSAYRFYIDNFMQPAVLTDEEMSQLKNGIVGSVTEETTVKNLAKVLSAISHAAVIIAFHKRNLYYTGLSHLLREPEFVRTENIFSLTSALEKFEDVLSDMVEESHKRESAPQIVIGDKCPLGKFISIVAAPFTFKNKKSMVGLVGPIRMNYNRNYSLIAFTQSLLN